MTFAARFLILVAGALSVINWLVDPNPLNAISSGLYFLGLAVIAWRA